jgi:hypothetical protein
MAGIADFRLPIAPPWRAHGHWKELPHHFFNRQSAISPPRRGNENLAFGLRLRAALCLCGKKVLPEFCHRFYEFRDYGV